MNYDQQTEALKQQANVIAGIRKLVMRDELRRVFDREGRLRDIAVTDKAATELRALDFKVEPQLGPVAKETCYPFYDFGPHDHIVHLSQFRDRIGDDYELISDLLAGARVISSNYAGRLLAHERPGSNIVPMPKAKMIRLLRDLIQKDALRVIYGPDRRLLMVMVTDDAAQTLCGMDVEIGALQEEDWRNYPAHHFTIHFNKVDIQSLKNALGEAVKSPLSASLLDELLATAKPVSYTDDLYRAACGEGGHQFTDYQKLDELGRLGLIAGMIKKFIKKGEMQAIVLGHHTKGYALTDGAAEELSVFCKTIPIAENTPAFAKLDLRDHKHYMLPNTLRELFAGFDRMEEVTQGIEKVPMRDGGQARYR